MSSEVEEWRPVVGHDMYDVSNLGAVRSWRLRGGRRGSRTVVPTLLKPQINEYRYGHVCVNVDRRMRYVHQLVLEAFVGPNPGGLDGCHNDGNPSNNQVENLRWDTRRNNLADCRKHGTRRWGERNNLTKLSEAQVREIRRRRAVGESARMLAAEFRIDPEQVRRIVNRTSWAHVE